MKTLMAAMLLSLVIFSSCTKEAPAIVKAVRSKVIVVTGSFSDGKQMTMAQMVKGEDTRYGIWSADHLRDSLPVAIDVTFIEEYAAEGDSGRIVMNAQLSGAKKTDLGHGTIQYNGTGDWHTTQSTGSLKSFMTAGAGTLTYSITDFSPQDGDEAYPPESHMELQGFTPR